MRIISTTTLTVSRFGFLAIADLAFLASRDSQSQASCASMNSQPLRNRMDCEDNPAAASWQLKLVAHT